MQLAFYVKQKTKKLRLCIDNACPDDDNKCNNKSDKKWQYWQAHFITTSIFKEIDWGKEKD